MFTGRTNKLEDNDRPLFSDRFTTTQNIHEGHKKSPPCKHTTGILHYTQNRGLSELDKHTEHFGRSSSPILHGLESAFRFCNVANQLVGRAYALAHVADDGTEIFRQRVARATNVKLFLHKQFRLECHFRLGITDANHATREG